PAGSYTSLTVNASGFVPASVSPISVPDGGTATQNFSLAGTPQSPCFTDTTQADWQVGVQTNTDVLASANDVVLVRPSDDAANYNVTGSGVGITVATWGGQTFTANSTGNLIRGEVRLFC